jgi:hypothetical protein
MHATSLPCDDAFMRVPTVQARSETGNHRRKFYDLLAPSLSLINTAPLANSPRLAILRVVRWHHLIAPVALRSNTAWL